VSVLNHSKKAAVSVSEMAALCQLSRSRFHALVREGVFPRPVQNRSGKRPFYTAELIERCLEIRQTGIGLGGLPVLFNRRPKRTRLPKPLRQSAQEKKPDHADLLNALKGLGLSATTQAVDEVLTALFPNGHAELDQGDVIRKLFLHLHAGKK
jgi:predicted DNA-binding transcriptional regulator AlpA